MVITADLKKDIKNYLKKRMSEGVPLSVTVKTAYALADAEEKELRNVFPELREAKIEKKVDDSIIAGFVLEEGSTLFDASVRGRLKSVVSALV